AARQKPTAKSGPAPNKNSARSADWFGSQVVLPVRNSRHAVQAHMHDLLDPLARPRRVNAALAQDAIGFRTRADQRRNLLASIPVDSRHFQQAGGIGEKPAGLAM